MKKNRKFIAKIKGFVRVLKNMRFFLKLHRIKFNSNINLDFYGTSYGGWAVPSSFLNKSSLCYSFGLGEDISFDIRIIEELNLKVFGFDPTPRSIEFIKNYDKLPKKFNFFPIGIWSENKKLKFYIPKNPNHVSHSITNIQKTNEFIEVNCKDLQTIMRDLNHGKIDILKMDIEGAEYEVLDDILKKNIPIKIILVEFHGNKRKIIKYVKKVLANDYILINYRNTDLTFIKKKFFINKKNF